MILDPVGAGATPFRTKAALDILREVRVALVRGNAAEIANLIGETAAIKGVDAEESESEPPVDLAVRAACLSSAASWRSPAGRTSLRTD